MILDFLSDIFHQFLILLILNHLPCFLLYNIFHQILYHQSYPSDFFYQIISQHCLYFSANSIFPVSIILYHQTFFIHHVYLYNLFHCSPFHHSYSNRSSPRCPLRSHYLVHSENNSYFLGIGPIRDVDLTCIFRPLFFHLYGLSKIFLSTIT